jgi:penicillin-binding protein 2
LEGVIPNPEWKKTVFNSDSWGQPGLGISNIEKYLRLFGFGSKTGIDFTTDLEGVIPNPEWKKTVFNGDSWRVGDTYNTSIGQYGVQITPIQALKAVSLIANGGNVITPRIIKTNENQLNLEKINISSDNIEIVKEGMRKTVTEGTAKTLYLPYVKISAKTGTAELGVSKTTVNSWVIGFFPSDKPKYAFALVMEKGKANNQIGAALVMRDVFEYLNLNKPEYLK